MRNATMAICPAPLNLIVLGVTAAAGSSQGTRFIGRCCVKDKNFVGIWDLKMFQPGKRAKHQAFPYLAQEVGPNPRMFFNQIPCPNDSLNGGIYGDIEARYRIHSQSCPCPPNVLQRPKLIRGVNVAIFIIPL